MLWQIQIIKGGGPTLIQEARSVYLLGKWISKTCKTWAEFYKIKMIDRASGYVDPDEDLQLEEEEDQDDEEE